MLTAVTYMFSSENQRIPEPMELFLEHVLYCHCYVRLGILVVQVIQAHAQVAKLREKLEGSLSPRIHAAFPLRHLWAL